MKLKGVQINCHSEFISETLIEHFCQCHPELESGSIHLILVMLNCGFWQVRRVSVANPARLGESCVEPVEPPIIQDGFSISNLTY